MLPLSARPSATPAHTRVDTPANVELAPSVAQMPYLHSTTQTTYMQRQQKICQAVLGGGARRRPGSAAVVGGAVDSFIQRPPSDAELNSPGRPRDDG